MGKFITKTGNDGQYYFNLKADNGQVILSSEGYTTTTARNNGIESVKKNAGNEANYDRLEAANGKYYFTLKAANSQVIGKSQMYESAQGRDNGIESVKTNAPTAIVTEEG
jgi:uncharacterized protein YegP (UPF0339 family)